MKPFTRLHRVIGWLALLGIALGAWPAAQAQYTYTNEGGAITIVGYTGPGGAVTIPDTIDGLPVARIGDGAFSGRFDLTSVIIPDSVTNIGEAAFATCYELTAITVDAFNLSYSSVEGVLFNKSQTLLVQYPGGKAGSYTIPDSVTRIGNGAFFYCYGLTNVIIGNSVTRIEDGAFSFSGLAGVTIGNSLTNIGNSAFAACTGLTNVIIPDSVTSIGDRAFASVMTDFLGSYSISGLTSVTIGNSVTNIGDWAFYFCPGLTNVIIGNSVTHIGNGVFSRCRSLTSITIPNSVTTFGNSAFSGCSGLTNVIIPSKVAIIRDGAFSSCTSLTSLTIPNSVTTIGDYAFAYCTVQTGVYFQGNAPVAGFDALSDTPAIVYYLPGTTGWEATFAHRPTARWFLPHPLILTSSPGPGVRNNEFGFTVSWATNAPVVVEACADLVDPVWLPVGTNTLTDGSSSFSDPEWTNHPNRFYRLR